MQSLSLYCRVYNTIELRNLSLPFAGIWFRKVVAQAMSQDYDGGHIYSKCNLPYLNSQTALEYLSFHAPNRTLEILSTQLQVGSDRFHRTAICNRIPTLEFATIQRKNMTLLD